MRDAISYFAPAWYTVLSHKNRSLTVAARIGKGVIDGGALLAEGANAAIGDVHAIFEANAKFAGDNHGLVTETHAGFETGLVPFDAIGPFVNMEADAVAGAVRQARQFVAWAEACIGDDLARGGVDRFARGAGPGGGQGGVLRLALQGPDFLLARGGCAEDHGAGDVGLIAIHRAAIVEQDHVAFVKGLRHGAAVGEGGVLAETDGDAALEAKGAVGGADVVAEFGRGHALAKRGEAGAVGFDGDIGRALHEREFRLGLDHAAAGGDRGSVDELSRGDLLAETVEDGKVHLLR